MSQKLRYWVGSLLVTLLYVAGVPLAHATSSDRPLAPSNEPLRLLQPLDAAGTSSIAPAPGIDIIFIYFNLAWPWILTVVAGIAVLNALIGGTMIIFSGGDATKRQEGIEKLLWSMAGFIILMLTGAILKNINPLFYR